MRVSRLEIFGFKSFMERLVLPLNKGVTGVVGPNGCGKSNIVDAIRWVLGETRIKNLRGGTLEDVIFNGTSNLRPLGLAEVSITLAADDGNFFSRITSSVVEAEVIAEGETPAEGEEVAPQEQSAYQMALQSKYSWLKSATEVQITRRLYRSGESEFFINQVPCRLKDLKEFCNAVGLAVRGFTIVAQGEVSKIVTSKAESRRQILEEAAGVQGFRDKIAATERRLEETQTNVSRLDDIIKEVSRQVGSLKRAAAKAKNRQSLKAEILELDEKVFSSKMSELKRRLDNLLSDQQNDTGKEQELDQKLVASRAVESEMRAALLELESKTDSVRTKSDSCRDQINKILRNRAEKQGRFNQVQAFIESNTGELKGIDERLALLHKRKSDSVEIVERLAKERETLSEELAKLENNSKNVDLALKTLDAAREALRAKDRELQLLRNSTIGKESSLNAIKEQLIAASPAKQLKSAIDGLENKPDFHGLLVDGLTVPEEYVTAVQAVIAEKAAYIVTDDPYCLAKIFNQAKQKNNRGIGILRSGSKNIEQVQTEFPSLLSLIKVRDSHQQAAISLLKDVYYVANVEQAFEYFAANQNSQILLVTNAGEIITANSFYVLQHESGLVQIKNRADQLEAELAEIEVKRLALDAERTSLLTAQQTAEQSYKDARLEYERQQQRSKELSNQVSSITGRLQAEKNVEQQIVQDMERARFSHQSVISKQQSYRDELERLKLELADLDPEEEKKFQSELEVFTSEFKELDKSRQETRSKLSEQTRACEQCRVELERLRTKISNQSLSIQKLELEQQTLCERFSLEYGEEFCQSVISEAKTMLDPGVMLELADKLRALKERLIREGEIDPDSIQQFEEESARLADLENQKQDLEKAAATLKETLTRLSKTSEERFLATFEAVKRNFEELIPRLFGGGKGTLELSDPNDPLNSGLEIIARPPGKKLKSIELLSGGEKAMCATALIMGMFMERPSPLCILDEVDAPLDDANLVRFLTMIRDMSDRTQFMVVTHNKQSMAVADNLVGVTMEQPGASKLISVSLQEAYEQVA